MEKNNPKKVGILGKTKGFFSDIKSGVMNMALDSFISPEKMDKMLSFVKKGVEAWLCEKGNEKILVAKPNKDGTVSVFIVKKKMVSKIEMDLETEKPLFRGDLGECILFFKEYALTDSSLSKMVDVK